MNAQEDIAVDLGALARERQDQSEQINELAAALAKAQGQMRPAVKDSENPAYKSGSRVSKYADFASVWEAIRKPLADNGLAVMQRVRTSDASASITTMLVHSSGQWVRDVSVWPAAQRTPQALGSAITYGKRYALSALVGVAADDDDDGNVASGVTAGRKPNHAPEPAGADAVRGALARPATASAKKAEAPKADDAVMARVLALSTKATTAGWTNKRLKDFAERVLQSKKPSAEFTADDIAALEAAWPAEQEPGSAG